MVLYHGSKAIVESPEIRIQKYNKDFFLQSSLLGVGEIQETNTSNQLSYSSGVDHIIFFEGR